MASSEDEFVLVSSASSESSDRDYVTVLMSEEGEEDDPGKMAHDVSEEEVEVDEEEEVEVDEEEEVEVDEEEEVEVDEEEEEVNFVVGDDFDGNSSTRSSMVSVDSETDDSLPSPNRRSLGFPRNVTKYMPHGIDLEEHPGVAGYLKRKEVDIADLVKLNVLPFLPAKSLCRFRAVSKHWDMWIGGPFLAHAQTTLFKEISGFLCQFPGEEPTFMSLDPNAYNIPCPSLSFLPESVDIRSTCNGLLACQSPFSESYYICSPATKQWRKLPEPILCHGPNTAIALEFEPQPLRFDEHFQLICVVTVPDQPVLYFEIYSSRSNSWRISSAMCCELGEVGLNGDGFYLGGYVYWESHSGVILAFNVKNEEYGFLSLPPGSNYTGALSWISGELCYLLPREQDEKIAIDVHGDMDMRLKRTVYTNRRVQQHEECRVLASVDEDTLIFSVGDRIFESNARTGQDRTLSLSASTGGFVKYLPYVNSLATVEANAEECFMA